MGIPRKPRYSPTKTIGDITMIKYSVYECHEYSESECIFSSTVYEEASAYCDEIINNSDDWGEWDTWYEIVIED